MKKQEQKQRRNEGGITLIALVVTIIILLILAGVTLTIALSENGLFSQAKRAVGEYENSVEKEDATLQEATRIMENLIQGTGGGTTPNTPKELVTSVTTTDHETKHVEDSLGNPVVIPGGFKFAGKDGDTVQDGIIIADDEENEFVWIPVSNTNENKTGLIKKEDGTTVEITLGRYTFATTTPGTPTPKQLGANHSERSENTKISINGVDYYEDTNAQKRPNGGEGAKNLAEFITSVETNHGYYIARYEASYKSGSNTNDYKIFTKPSTSCSSGTWRNTLGRLWNNITQGDASTIAKNMYSGIDSEAKYVESDLVNSYAWDTAIVYIQAMGNDNYANMETNHLLKDTGATGDEKCHIFDMAGNLFEWTTEYSTYANTVNGNKGPCVCRGGGCDVGYHYTAYRDYFQATDDSYYLGFRPLLYLK